MSADGGLVAFDRRARDLAPVDDDGGLLDLFVRDVAAGHTRWLGAGLPVEVAGLALSPDGRWSSPAARTARSG